MNAHDDDEPPRACDDTLDDAPAANPANEEERRWLMEQRFVHGLLRALNTQDAAGRETRVAAILHAIHTHGARRAWLTGAGLAVAAGLLIAALVQLTRDFIAPLPRAEALVESAVAKLGEVVDRRYSLRLTVGKADEARHATVTQELTMRPGRRFVLEGPPPPGPMSMFMRGHFRIGCDGRMFWMKLEGTQMQFPPTPIDDAPRNAMAAAFLESGLLGLDTLLANLPKDCTLRSVRREPSQQAGGPALIRVEATRLPERHGARIRTAFLLVEEGSGVVRHLEIHFEPRLPFMPEIVAFDYTGTVKVDESFYAPPK